MTAPAQQSTGVLRVRSLLVVLAAAVALTPLLGAPMPLAWGVAGATWFIVLRQREVGSPFAIVAAGTLVFFAMLVVLIATAMLRIDALAALAASYAVIAAAGAWMATRRRHAVPTSWPRPGVPSVLIVLAPFTGAAAWLASRLVASAMPVGSSVAWATLNDAANSLMFGRQIIIDDGIRLGITENPVPFVASIIASMTMPGRADSTSDGVASHDVLAFVSTWSLLIAALCVAVGLLARQMLRDASRTMRVLGPAVASLLPLSWMISGLSFEYGYINVPPTLILLVGSLVAYFASRQAPVLAFAVIVASGAMMMTSWSPLTLMPAFLAMLVLVRHARRLWSAPMVVRLSLTALVLFVLILAIAVVLPTFNASRDAIVSDVSFYPFRLRHLIVLLVVVSALAAVLWWKRGRADAMLAFVAIAVGGGSAIGVFLYARRNEAELWAYYSYKALWFLLMILLILAVVYAIAAIGDLTKRAWISASALGMVGVCTIAYGSFANHVPEYGAMNAIERVVTGTVLVDNAGDRAWDTILELADSDPHAILWNSSDPNEVFIDFWLIKLASPGFDDSELHVLAYVFDRTDVADLCRFAELTGPALRVITADEDLVGAIEQCGNPDLIVEVER